jgi:transcriptional regulator with GAF, ATPase, and Fis domain
VGRSREEAAMAGSRNPHLEVLRRVTEQMTESRDLTQVLTSITNGLADYADMVQTAVYLYLDDRDCPECRARPSPARALHIWATAGVLSRGEYSALHRVEVGHFTVGRAAARKERLVVTDFAESYRAYLSGSGSGGPLGAAAAENPEVLRPAVEMFVRLGVQSAAVFPLLVRDELVGVLGCWALRPMVDDEVEHLAIFARQAATAIKTAELFEQVERANAILATENAYLRAETLEETGFGEVVGKSAAVRAVLRAGRQVAATSSTVLLLGETGSGKEVIARAIHQLSPRRDRPLVKVNCGAIAAGLAESELFGHERGAFTGALQRRAGRFEIADQGTLFMDEIGELSLDLQVKLLRVVQEQEFERLGGHQVVRVDVRLIAATNRDLAEEVKAGRFRADLYYRLNVFPIRVPPLRERREDIILLAAHFLKQLARRLGRPFRGFSPETLRQLEHYDWPGNVRELHNVVERMCVLAPGPVVELVEPLLPANPGTHTGDRTLRAAERDHIRKVLGATHWKIEGVGGAAEVLGLAPSTLRARMQKLGISRGGRKMRLDTREN